MDGAGGLVFNSFEDWPMADSKPRQAVKRRRILIANVVIEWLPQLTGKKGGSRSAGKVRRKPLKRVPWWQKCFEC
jgi:hypothetical protein